MSDEILQGNNGGVITVVSRNKSGTEWVDRSSDGGFGVENPLVAQAEKERSHLSSRMRGIVKESDERCECSMPTRLRGKDTGHCVNCGGRIA